MNELAFRPAVELAELVADRQVSPTELVEHFLDRIERYDTELNSVVTRDPEGAFAAARSVEAQLGEEAPGSLAGVPLLLKDLHLAAGLRTTCGTSSLAEFVPDMEEEHITRLRHAGVVVLGKTNVPELGTVPFTESELLGACANPWDLSHTPGGSSGGAAAAVSAGLHPVGHSSDGGGSVRIPASNCGLVGLKPSRGRISNAPLFDVAGLVTPGAIARHTVDAAALVDAMRGYAVGDPYTAPEPERPFVEEARSEPGRLRIGVVDSWPWGDFDGEALDGLRHTADLLDGLGHEVEPATVDIPHGFKSDFETIWAARLAALPFDPAMLEPVNAWLDERGNVISAPEVLAAITRLQQGCQELVAATAGYDGLMAPTLSRPPLKLGELAELAGQELWDALSAYVALAPVANATGQPSISLPTHRSTEGLPMGTMMTGRPGDEATLLRLAGQLEPVVGWPEARPPTLGEPAW
jgi:amidase